MPFKIIVNPTGSEFPYTIWDEFYPRPISIYGFDIDYVQVSTQLDAILVNANECRVDKNRRAVFNS